MTIYAVDWYREGVHAGKEAIDLTWQQRLARHRDEYALLCKLNQCRKSISTYREFLRGCYVTPTPDGSR